MLANRINWCVDFADHRDLRHTFIHAWCSPWFEWHFVFRVVKHWCVLWWRVQEFQWSMWAPIFLVSIASFYCQLSLVSLHFTIYFPSIASFHYLFSLCRFIILSIPHHMIVYHSFFLLILFLSIFARAHFRHARARTDVPCGWSIWSSLFERFIAAWLKEAGDLRKSCSTFRPSSSVLHALNYSVKQDYVVIHDVDAYIHDNCSSRDAYWSLSYVSIRYFFSSNSKMWCAVELFCHSAITTLCVLFVWPRLWL